jgi:hypothetical protein
MYWCKYLADKEDYALRKKKPVRTFSDQPGSATRLGEIGIDQVLFADVLLSLASKHSIQLTDQPMMNSLRFARTALRARPAALRVPLQRRSYAEAVPDKASPRPALGLMPDLANGAHRSS